MARLWGRQHYPYGYVRLDNKETLDSPSPFQHEVHPVRQALVFAVALPVTIIVFQIPNWIGIYDLDDHFPWTVAAAFTLLFGVANSVLSLAADDQNKYWGGSIMCYMAVLVFGGFIAWLFSGLNVYEAKSFRWIYIVFTFGYLLFLCMVRAMRKIVQIAQKQDARLRGEELDDTST